MLVLSQEGSFSRAAEVLHISQPSLSQYIKNIEREVGAPLFVRRCTATAVRLLLCGVEGEVRQRRMKIVLCAQVASLREAAKRRKGSE